jgi:signal transduction histidine kinase
MYFSSLKDLIPGKNQAIDKASQLLEQAATDVRRISHNMMPGLLTKYGLIEALKDLFEQLDEMQGINGLMKVTGKQSRLDEKIEIMLYRIIQEMINNTLKHAEADTIMLNLQFQPEKLIVHFSDDGKGFDFNDKLGSRSFGLTGLQSRVKFLGSELMWDSSPGRGTAYNFQVLI